MSEEFRLRLRPRKEMLELLGLPEAPEGHVVIPVKPTDALLMSMAVRYDHGLGMPGYYDQELFSASGVTHAQRLESALGTMRQLHEEVVGKGFYRPENDGGLKK
jgi:hypothetical protein